MMSTPRPHWYALLYALLLREQGYARDEISALVGQRYPTLGAENG